MSAFLEVEHLTAGYGPLVAVEDVTFAVSQGEHVTLLGPSGCGKTTTLRTIAGLETPKSGRIVIDGKVIFDADEGRNVPPEKRGLAMVFQSYAIWPHMSVFDNVGFGFRVRGIGRRQARPAVERALSLVTLSAVAGRPASALSGGQQQRVALARAIAYESKVLLLDEPMSNLDAQLRTEMREELNDLRRQLGFTAVYVTHDQEEAFALSDRIVVMRGGRIEQQGAPSEIYCAPKTSFVAAFLGMKNIFDAELYPISGDRKMVEARLAPDVVLRVLNSWITAAASHPARIGFRPIDVRLETAGAAPAEGTPGIVTRSLFLGDVAHYYVRSGPIEICAHGRPRSEIVEGRAVRWSVDPDRCVVLRE
ncbi:MAG TPA: ABC transporter ATP-binding protein [Alphaproteobacteria bacterium]|nr:ABC transporter ATP-binding protein [Alphaproteobacteria bacterium]